MLNADTYLEPRKPDPAILDVPGPEAEPPPWDDDEVLAREQLAALRELRIMALDLARLAHARATAVEDAGDAGDAGKAGECGDADDAKDAGANRPERALAPEPGAALDRHARTVRLTVMLEQRIIAARKAGFPAPGARAAAQPAPRPEPEPEPMDPARLAKIQARWDLLMSRRAAIVRAVRETLAAEGRDPEEVENLSSRISDNLRDRDRERMLVLNRPIGGMIARVCRTLGLTPDWTRWADTPWAVEEAETVAKGSPYGDPNPPIIYWRAGKPWCPEGDGPIEPAAPRRTPPPGPPPDASP